MIKKKQGKNQEGYLEIKWRSYRGTGITATNKGKNTLVLREGLGGDEFAIVKLFGGCSTNSPTKVIEEIRTTTLHVAQTRFNKTAKDLGFKAQPIRVIDLLP